MPTPTLPASRFPRKLDELHLMLELALRGLLQDPGSPTARLDAEMALRVTGRMARGNGAVEDMQRAVASLAKCGGAR